VRNGSGERCRPFLKRFILYVVGGYFLIEFVGLSSLREVAIVLFIAIAPKSFLREVQLMLP
jgi:hypothetical protein